MHDVKSCLGVRYMVGFAWLNFQKALEMRKRECDGGAERGITAVGNVMPHVPLDMIGLFALALRRHLRAIRITEVGCVSAK